MPFSSTERNLVPNERYEFRERTENQLPKDHTVSERKGGGILGIRCEQEFPGQKTAIDVDEEFLKANGIDIDALQKLFSEKIPDYRPEYTVVEKTPGGRPKIVQTPGQTKLHEKANYGFMKIFGVASPYSTPSKSTTEKMTASDIILDELVTPPINSIKVVSIHITKESLATAEEERKKNHYRRKKDQQTTMARKGYSKREASATKIVEKIRGAKPKTSQEWCHLIAHAFLGELGQDPRNLVAGSKHANTNNIFAEWLVKVLVKLYPEEGIDLNVECTTEENTHIGKIMKYEIVTPDFTIPFRFDMQEERKPSIINKQYFEQLAVILEQQKKSIEENEVDEIYSRKQPTFFKPAFPENLLPDGEKDSKRKRESSHREDAKKKPKVVANKL